MVDIADTSALLAWPAERVSSALAVPSQMAEVEKFSPERAMLYQAQGPQWVQPSNESIAAARSAAATTGDLPGLSGVDIELLALTIEKNGVLHSDDYRLQNVATSAGIEWRSVGQSGIRVPRSALTLALVDIHVGKSPQCRSETDHLPEDLTSSFGSRSRLPDGVISLLIL